LKIPPPASKNKVNPNPGDSQQFIVTKKFVLKQNSALQRQGWTWNRMPDMMCSRPEFKFGTVQSRPHLKEDQGIFDIDITKTMKCLSTCETESLYTVTKKTTISLAVKPSNLVDRYERFRKPAIRSPQMEAARLSETLVLTYQFAWQHISEDCNL
jgi:hypothetical protein